MKPLQWKAIDLLADGATQKNAAAQCGVAAFTIRRWQKCSEFQEALSREIQKLREKDRDRRSRDFETIVANIQRTKPHFLKIREQNEAVPSIYRTIEQFTIG